MVSRGRTWRKGISELLLQLNLGSQEILAEDYNVNVFLERVNAVLRERECREFNEGLVKLSLYKSFCNLRITCKVLEIPPHTFDDKSRSVLMV